MKPLYISIILFIAGIASFAQGSRWEWAMQAGGTDVVNGNAIAIDGKGNSYVLGAVSGDLLFNTSVYLTMGNGYAVFIAKLDTSGNVIWAKGIGGSSLDFGRGIAVDANGNSYITGFFSSYNMVFDSIVVHNGTASYNMFIAKYDSMGNALWAKGAGGIGDVAAIDIALDSNQNSYITGFFSCDTLSLGGIPLINRSTNFFPDLYLAKYSSTGNVLWAKSFGGSNIDNGINVALDIDGDLYVSGYFSDDSLVLDTITLKQVGGSPFIAKFTPSGNVLWAKNIGALTTSMCTDLTKNLLITGNFNGSSISFGSFVLTSPANSSDNLFLVKFDSLGTIIWAKAPSGAGSKKSTCIRTDTNENSYVSGYFDGSYIAFDTISIANTGTKDAFVVKYNKNGNAVWGKGLNGRGQDLGNGVALDNENEVYLIGTSTSPSIYFDSLVTYGGGIHGSIFTGKLSNPNYATITSHPNESNQLLIFPNPSGHRLNIICNERINNIRIIDLMGQTVFQSQPKEKNVSLQLTHAGMYFVSVTSNYKTTTQKILVQE